MEQIIIFVYDTSFCQSEEDDPQKAVLFFHPKWVSDQQRLALCGQLMGAAHFCSTVFSIPQVLSLQSGKFILKKFGQYILSVGSDQTMPDWILKERFETVQNVIEFYHKSFESILISVNSDYELFRRKLSDMFEVYSPLIEYIVSKCGNIPIIKFPKKKNTMFLEAFQLLESCCTFDGILGGTILHNGRVIATLLDSDVTKILALTDPHRVRCGAEQIKTSFHLPLGVQLIKVYVKRAEYESSANLGILRPSLAQRTKKKENITQGSEVRHDITKIFTVPEEEDGNIAVKGCGEVKDTNCREDSRKRCRKFFRSKNESSSRERSRNFVPNHNIKICSTPTIEKKFVHEDLVSICNNQKAEPRSTPQSSCVADIMQCMNKTKQKDKYVPSRHTYNCLYRISMDDLMIDFSQRNCPVPLRYYSFGLPKICKEVEQSLKDEKNKEKLHRSRFYKTIADPSNPIFRYDGFPVSKSLYNHCLDEHYKDFIMANIAIDLGEEFIRRKTLENELIKIKSEENVEEDESKNAINKLTRMSSDRKYSGSSDAHGAESSTERELSSINQKLFRRSLTLPLKPISYTGNDNSVPMSVVKNKVLSSRTPTTPLMTKLSLLVLEEENDKGPSVGIQHSQSTSRLTTESCVKKEIKSTENDNSDMMSCGLFVFGQRSLSLLLLLDDKAGQNPDLILSLWEIGTTNLEKVELLRNKSMDHLSNTGVSSSYSFLSLDPQWGTMQKSGAWGNDEMKAVGSLHQDMILSPNITEIIVRNEDTVIYGYRCGNTETFYHQGGSTAIGLPTPADLMGVIPMKARRRLERDHGTILL